MADFTAGREKRRVRPRGYAPWRPQAKTMGLLAQVKAVIVEYERYLPLTVRQVYYRLVGAHGYEKTEAAYERLAEKLNRARRSRLIPFDVIRDDGVVTFTAECYGGIADFHDETAQRIRAYRRDRQVGQPARLELWSEAAGMLAQLARVADEFSVPVYSCGGFASLTASYAVAERALGRAVPTVLLHVGDFDPSGQAIFDHLAEDAAAFAEANRVIATQRIEAERVALSAEQVANYDLPTAPPKPSDSRSARWDGETCQLEALPPDVLADIVRDAIEARINLDTLEDVKDDERRDRAELLSLPRGGDG